MHVWGRRGGPCSYLMIQKVKHTNKADPRKVAAILEFLKKWCHYASGIPLVIKTDHQVLKLMTEQRVHTSMQHIKLMKFDYIIEYKKGQANKVVDALSRQAHLMAITSVTSAWTEDIENSDTRDTHCLEIIAKVTSAAEIPVNYGFTAGILRNKGRIIVRNNEKLKEKLLTTFNSSPMGDHSGIKSIYQRIKIFFWPNLKKEVEYFI